MKKFRSLLLISLACLLILLTATVAAQSNSNQLLRDNLRPISDYIDLSNLNEEITSSPRNFGVSGPNEGKVDVMVQLAGEPAWRTYLDAQSANSRQAAVSLAQNQIDSIQSAQNAVLSAIEAAGIESQQFFSLQKTYNGIAMRVDSAELAKLNSIPGVLTVVPLPKHELQNSTSVPLINAPQVWDSAGVDATGEGISIAIIDTGVDYIHTHFGGSGLQADYDANDTTTIADGGFPTGKVVGGYDFVGDDYDAGADNPIVAPDDDPMDCQGHGTHVAGTAAGYGVNDDGTTYADGYGPDTDFMSMKIGAGVAPDADIYALRVFGCGGSTNFTAAAIEWATDPNGDGDPADAVDVINMSLGSSYGGAIDPSADASNMAVDMGIIVVAASGNSGDAHYVTSSPGTADKALSVAASADAGTVFDAIEVSNSGTGLNGLHAAAISVQYPWTDPSVPVSQTIPVTAELVYPDDDMTGCAPFSAADAAKISGKIVLLDWTEPSCGGSVTRTGNATTAGAIGVIIADNAGGDLRIFGSAIVPAVSVPADVGNALRSELTARGGGGLMVTMDLAYLNALVIIDDGLIDTLAGFSSRGPRRNMPNAVAALKPEITAPGLTTFSAERLSGTEGSTKSGTSMATPHVAGMMALLREMHPSWSVEELKALAMNTATNPLFTEANLTGDTYAPARIGTGRIDLAQTVDELIVAYNATDAGLVGVSFGNVPVVDTYEATKMVAVTNKGTTSATYNLALDIFTDAPGVEFALSADTLTLSGGETQMVEISVSADADDMNHTFTDSTMSDAINTVLGRSWLTEESGQVIISNVAQAGHSLNVPVYISANPASQMSGNVPMAIRNSPTLNLNLTGKSVDTGPNLPVDVLSLVTAFELQSISPNEPSVAEADSADLKYVGAHSDLLGTATLANPTGYITDTTIYFGIATHDKWSTLNEVEFDIYIDSDTDGTTDYILFNWNVGSAFGGAPTDEFWTLLLDLETNELMFAGIVNSPPFVLDTAIFNTNVAVLPVTAFDIDLNTATQSFDYFVVTFDRDVNGAVDVSETMRFSATPGLDALPSGVEGMRVLADLDDATYPIEVDEDAFRDHGGLGLLLLHHHNATNEDRAQIILEGEPSAITMSEVSTTSLSSTFLIAVGLILLLCSIITIRRHKLSG